MSVRRTVFVTVVGVLGVVAVQRMSVGVPAAAVAVNNAETNVVRDCGAVPDGSTDNLAVLQDCITQAESTGRSLYFPPGTYNVNGTLEITKDNFSIRGANRETSQLVEQDPTADLLVAWNAAESVKGANPSLPPQDVNVGIPGTTAAQNVATGWTSINGPLNHFTVKGLGLSYASGAATGTALRCVSCWRTYIENMNFGNADVAGSGGGTSLAFVNYGSWVGDSVHVRSSTFRSPTSRAIYAVQTGEVHLEDVDVRLDKGNNSQAGVVLDSASGGFYVSNVDVSGGKFGFVTQNTLRNCEISGAPTWAGEFPCWPPAFGFFTNCFATSQSAPGGVGWSFQAGKSMVLVNSGASGAATQGISATNVDGLTIGASQVAGNGEAGILVGAAATSVDIHSSAIAGNSTSAPGSYPGIMLHPKGSGASIQNNRIGAQATFGNSQGYAVTVASGYGDVLQVTGNNLLNNLTGGLQILGARGSRWSTQSTDWG